MFIDGTEVFNEAQKFGMTADSCTEDGAHPNDLGCACMAKVFGDSIKSSYVINHLTFCFGNI